MRFRDITHSYVDGSVLQDADAVLHRYEIALFTVPGEFSPDPDFGIGIQQWVGEANTKENAESLRRYVISKTKKMFPQIQVLNCVVYQKDLNTSTIEINVIIIPYNKRATIKKDITNE